MKSVYQVRLILFAIVAGITAATATAMAVGPDGQTYIISQPSQGTSGQYASQARMLADEPVITPMPDPVMSGSAAPGTSWDTSSMGGCANGNCGGLGSCDGSCGGSCGSGGCSSGNCGLGGSCGGGGCGDGLCGGGGNGGYYRKGMWFASVDYLLMRPRFSQAVGEVRRTDTLSQDELTATRTDESIAFPFQYSSSFRVNLGCRDVFCGCDFSVAYWRLTSNTAQINDGPVDVTANNPAILGQLKNDPDTDGQFFAAQAGVVANIFDIDFGKNFPFGGPQNSCDCNYCPRWDLRWTAGVRIADISRFDNNRVTGSEGELVSTGNIDARFVGAGPRVGLQGRRYFGQNGLWSAFAKGSQGLLIGDFNMSRIKTVPQNSPNTTAITQQFDTFSRMVPVTDIEIGGSWQIGPYCFVSAGWFFQCWWDLGQAENIVASNFGALDSANILGFDGLFVRCEMFF